MTMKKVYSTKTGKVTWAQPNPARPGEYLMPADATEFPPPAFDDSSRKAKYVNNSWVTEDLTPQEIHEASGSTGTFIGQLDDIGNITLDSVTNGQALIWDAENNKWTNGNVAAGEGEGGGIGFGGAVLQVKHNPFPTNVVSPSQSWVDAQTVTFTPKSTTSKILVMVNYGIGGKGAICLLRNGTPISSQTSGGDSYMFWQHVDQTNSDSGSERQTMSLVIEDQPNTTSAVTYKTQLMGYDQNGICVNPAPYRGGNGVFSGMTIWEIDETSSVPVQVTNPTNGETLVYENGKWVNQATPETGIDGITSVDGKIGIGTSSPQDTLHLSASSAVLRIENTDTNGMGAIEFWDAQNGTSQVGLIRYDDVANLFQIQGNSNGTIFLTPSNTFPNTTEAMRIDRSGRVGIGTADPTRALHVKSTSPIIHLQDSNAANTTEVTSYIDFRDQNDNRAGYIGFGSAQYHHIYIDNRSSGVLRYQNTNGYGDIGPGNISWFHFYTNRPAFYFNKNCQASGGFSTYSDERLKENVTVVENAVDALKKIRGVSFTWRTDVDSQERRKGKMFGVLAQEVLQIDPEMCEQPEAVIDGDEKYYTFDYSNLTPYFIEAIKEQQVTIESQQAKIDSLEARLAALEAKVS